MTAEIMSKSMKARNKKKQKLMNKKKQAEGSLCTTNSSDSGLNMNEAKMEDEEEMSCFYVDPITGEIQTISLEHDTNLKQNRLKEHYTKDFGISEKAFNLTQEFFNEYKKDYALCLEFLRRIIMGALSKRVDIIATEEDINRLLSSLDSDHDGQINLREFFQLLLLFLSDRSNLQKRIQGVLMEQSYLHETEGYLTFQEAQKFTNFLNKFYGKPVGSANNFFKGMYHRNKHMEDIRFDYEEVTYSYYASQVYENFNEMCFVR